MASVEGAPAELDSAGALLEGQFVPGVGWFEERGLELDRVRFVFTSAGNEGVEDAFERGGGTRPAAGKGLTMNRQFAEQATHRVGIEIKIGQSRVAAKGQRRVVCWRKVEAGLGEPMAEERFEMLPAADALHVFLRGERGMPG